VVTAGMDEDSVLELLRRSSDAEVKVSLIPSLVEAIGTAVEVDDLEGVTVLGLNPPTLARSSRLMKRGMDIAIAFTVLLFALPVMLVAAVAIKLTSPGPILFTQERVGCRGRRFRIFKFRTMCEDAEERAADLRERSAHSAWLLLEDDPRITRIGGILRRTSIDELPQLWNVLEGDMSLVGPRPIRPVFFEELAHDLPAYWQRLVVRPGLTGLAQVRRGYETSMAEKLAHDLEWIADRSVALYLRTVIATAWRVLRQSLRGAARPGA